MRCEWLHVIKKNNEIVCEVGSTENLFCKRFDFFFSPWIDNTEPLVDLIFFLHLLYLESIQIS